MDFFDRRRHSLSESKQFLLKESPAPKQKKKERITLESMITKIPLKTFVFVRDDLIQTWDIGKYNKQNLGQWEKHMKILKGLKSRKTLDNRKSIELPRGVKLDRRFVARFNFNYKNIAKVLGNKKNQDIEIIEQVWAGALRDLEDAVKICENITKNLDISKAENLTKILEKETDDFLKDITKPFVAAEVVSSFWKTFPKNDYHEEIEKVNSLIDEWNSGLAWFEVDEYEQYIDESIESLTSGYEIRGMINTAFRETYVWPNKSSSRKKRGIHNLESDLNSIFPFSAPIEKMKSEDPSKKKMREKYNESFKKAMEMKLALSKIIIPAYEVAKNKRGMRR